MFSSAYARSIQIISTVVSALLLVCCLNSTLFAQTGTSRISGMVTDPAGARISGAQITISHDATGVTYAARTNDAGAYIFAALPVGDYTLTVAAAGFRTYRSLQNRLAVGEPLTVNVKLQVGSPVEEITVRARFERLATANGALGNVIERKTITELPLNGRNPLALIVLEPGLLQRTNNGQGSGTHVNGSRDRAFDVTIDGVDANEPSAPNPQQNVYRLNPDNLAEYRVTTHSATAENGRNSGAQVAIATRSGTSEYHGTLFEFLRNTVLNANDFYNNAFKADALARGDALQAEKFARPDLKLNQFGFEIGGPIIKTKTFFFASYQNQRIILTQPIAAVATSGIPLVYTPQARAGIFRYFVVDQANPFRIGGVTINGNTPQLVEPGTGRLRPEVPLCDATRKTNCVAEYNIFADDPNRLIAGAQSGADPKIKALLDRYPAPNTFTVGDGLNTAGYAWNTPSRTQGPNYLFRVDHTFNEHHGVFGRLIYSDYDTSEGDFANARPRIFPDFPPLGEVKRSATNLALNHRWVINSNIVNESTFGLARFNFLFTFGESNPAYPNIEPFSFGNITLPVTNSPHTERTLTTVQFLDNLSVARGAHAYRFGLNVRLVRHDDSRGIAGGLTLAPTVGFGQATRTPGVSTGFASLPPIVRAGTPGINGTDNGRLLQTVNELLGIPAQISQTFISDPKADVFLGNGNIFNSGIRYKRFDSYAQDEWKLTPRLAVNYGLRWEVVLPPTEAAGRVYVPSRRPDIFDPNNLISFVNADGWYDNTSWKAIAPRLSFAYSLNARTVLRAGYSIAFDPISTFQVTAIAGKTPGLVTRDVRNALEVSPKRIGEGFPLSLPAPDRKPSAFYTPQVRPKLQAPAIGAFDPNLKLPTVHQWNLTVQRELPLGIALQATYVGKRGLRLLRAYNLNQIRTDHDGLAESFLAAKQNLLNKCNPNGMNCPAGVTSLPVGILLRLSDPNFLNSSAMQTNLLRNALGAVVAEIDANIVPTQRNDINDNPFRADFFRPNPQFGEIFWLDSGGDSYYHSLQLSAQRRFDQGLSFGIAYTFGKSIDDMSVDPVGVVSGGGLSTAGDRTPTDIHNWRLDRAVSDFDRTHVLTANGVYDLPFEKLFGGARGWRRQLFGGWGLSGIFTLMTGQPFQVNSGALTNHDSHISRAEITGTKPEVKLRDVAGFIGPSILTPDDRAQFDFPAPGSNGSQGRNVFRGTGYVNLDLGALKQFTLTERVSLQFRAEFFNALNHPNFETPRDATIGTPSLPSTQFGRTCCTAASTPSSASIIAIGESPRVIQFALKLSF
ncbi:MAG: TonB-dependent receptor [Acidobacteriota bacterium]